MESADDQGAGEQGRPVRQTMYVSGLYTTIWQGPSLPKTAREDGNEDQGNQNEPLRTAATLITNADA